MLQLRTLTVRKQFESVKTPSGIHRPRVFRATPSDFTDAEDVREMGARLKEGMTPLRVVRAERYEHTAVSVRPDQQWAKAYTEACKALNDTPGGRKARELLLESLMPNQRRDAERLGYFDVWVHGPVDSMPDPTQHDQGLFLSTVKFRIDRRFPNGNILMGLPERGWEWQICLHPLTPYPVDDICLAQLVMILMDPDEVISTGTIHDIKTQKLMRGRRLYERPRPPSDLRLPYLKEYPVQ